MITELILKILLAIPNALLDILSPIAMVITIPSEFAMGLARLLFGLGFLVPINHFFIVFACKQALRIARLSWAMVIRVKSFIPTMGS